MITVSPGNWDMIEDAVANACGVLALINLNGPEYDDEIATHDLIAAYRRGSKHISLFPVRSSRGEDYLIATTKALTEQELRDYTTVILDYTPCGPDDMLCRVDENAIIRLGVPSELDLTDVDFGGPREQ